MPKPGGISVFSQSGALCTGILDWAALNGLGFSRFVSLGNKGDLNETDFLEMWRDDPNTNVVMAYLEGVVDGDAFLEAARRFYGETLGCPQGRSAPTQGIDRVHGQLADPVHPRFCGGSLDGLQRGRALGALGARRLERLRHVGLHFGEADLPEAFEPEFTAKPAQDLNVLAERPLEGQNTDV